MNFTAACQRDKTYRQLSRGRRRSKADLAIEQCVMKVAERELGKLEVELSELKGKLKEGRERRRTDKAHGALALERQRYGYLLMVSRLPRQFGMMLVTPYSDLLGPARQPTLIGPPKDEDPNEAVKDPTDSNGWTARAYDVLPKPAKFVADFAEVHLRKLTPLGTAILLIAVVSGAWVWAERSKSTLQGMFDVVVKERDDLRKSASNSERLTKNLQKQEAEVKRLTIVSETQQIRIAGFERTVEEAKERFDAERLRHEKEVGQLRSDHSNEIARFGQNLDKAISDRMAGLETRANDDQRKIEGLSKQIEEQAKEIGRLSEIEKEVEKLRSALTQTNDSFKTKDKELGKANTELFTARQESQYFKILATSVVAHLDDRLLRCKGAELDFYQQDFRKVFNQLYSAAPDLFQRAGMRKL